MFLKIVLRSVVNLKKTETFTIRVILKILKVKYKHQVTVGLGSNLNNPKQQVLSALTAIDSLPETNLERSSKYYASKPQGPQDQPDFVNAVAVFSTDQTPEEFLKSLQGVEKNQGKIKLRHWGERLIDLDILLFDNLQLNSETLTIPHPEISTRDFVLIPLVELLPNYHVVGLGKLEDLINELSTKHLIEK